MSMRPCHLTNWRRFLRPSKTSRLLIFGGGSGRRAWHFFYLGFLLLILGACASSSDPAAPAQRGLASESGPTTNQTLIVSLCQEAFPGKPSRGGCIDRAMAFRAANAYEVSQKICNSANAEFRKVACYKRATGFVRGGEGFRKASQACGEALGDQNKRQCYFGLFRNPPKSQYRAMPASHKGQR